jgi:hypothetical protein
MKPFKVIVTGKAHTTKRQDGSSSRGTAPDAGEALLRGVDQADDTIYGTCPRCKSTGEVGPCPNPNCDGDCA